MDKSNASIYGSQSARARTRSILRDAWNGNFTGSFNGKNPVIGGFRRTQNAGDFLSRQNVRAKGPNPLCNLFYTGGINHKRDSNMNGVDDQGVPISATNVRYVYDSSLFTRYLKQKAYNPIYAAEKSSSP